jgi:hypothetical protein
MSHPFSKMNVFGNLRVGCKFGWSASRDIRDEQDQEQSCGERKSHQLDSMLSLPPPAALGHYGRELDSSSGASGKML